MAISTLSPASSPNFAVRFALLPLTVAALFLSAALLFSVQPMFTRMVLPVLGGSPSVWSVAMVMFQAVLLAGYAYAHALSSCASIRRATVIHVALMVIAAAFLPIALPGNAALPAGEGSVMWFVTIFLMAVAVPFLAVAGNGPLLQAWFARSQHAAGEDPYHLYAASNIGSFVGLLSYPLIVEPNFGLVAQSSLWSLGFAVLAVLIAAAGITAGQAQSKAIVARVASAAPLALRRVCQWIALAFIPSALLVAVTAHISSDIAAAPFLWVVPLALFLLTFVLTFRKTPLVSSEVLHRLQLAIIGIVIVVRSFSLTLDIAASVLLDLLALFIAAMSAHAALVALRPEKERLTLFYLSMSLGGVLGGSFTALLAPLLFSSIAEFPITLLLCLATPLILAPPAWTKTGKSLALGIVIGGVIVSCLYAFPDITGPRREPVLLLGLVMAVMSFVLLYRHMLAALTVAMALLAGEAWLSPFHGKAESVRSFFGVHRMVASADGRFRLLFHGTTLHGARQVKDSAGAIVKDAPPTMYYHQQSPFADAIDSVRRRKAQFSASIVGLGAGALAWYGRDQSDWRYFEIDPAVVDIALDQRQFGFMSPDDRRKISVGDARLTLTSLGDGSQDLIVLDAFSSDSIPTHLLTVEAMSLYVRKLAPRGLLLMHVSNRNLELASVVAANAGVLGLTGARRLSASDDFENTYRAAADVIALARAPADLDDLIQRAQWWSLVPLDGVKPWSDDYADLPAAIYRRLWSGR